MPEESTGFDCPVLREADNKASIPYSGLSRATCPDFAHTILMTLIHFIDLPDDLLNVTVYYINITRIVILRNQ